MAVFYAVFDRRETGELAEGLESGSAKILAQAPKSSEIPAWSGKVETAKVVKIEAASAKEAATNLQNLFPGSCPNRPITVAEGNFKETVA